MKILIRKHHGTIYPERGGYTGVIDLGYDGRGNRQRIKRKGRTKQDVKDRLISAVDDLEAGIKTSDSYTVGEAVRDWLDKGTRDLGVNTIETYRILIDKHLVPQIAAIKVKEAHGGSGRRLARGSRRDTLHSYFAQAPRRIEARHPPGSGPRYGRPKRRRPSDHSAWPGGAAE